MKRKILSLIMMTAAVSALIQSSGANATSDTSYKPGLLTTQWVAPGDGQTDVVLNAAIYVGAGLLPEMNPEDVPDASEIDAVVLESEDGVGVEVSRSWLISTETDSFLVLTPEVLLAESSTYILRVGGEEVSRFETGVESDDEIPATPSVTITESTPYVEMCGLFLAGNRGLFTANVELAEGELALFRRVPGAREIYNREGDDFDVESASGVVRVIHDAGTIELSEGTGEANPSWEVFIIDQAGNLSPGVTVTVEAEPELCEDGGCSAVGGGSLSSFGAALMVLLGRRRRR